MIITKDAVDFFVKLQYNKGTRKTYKSALSQFIGIDTDTKSIQEVVSGWTDLSEATVRVRRSALGGFMQYLSNLHEGVDDNVLNAIIWPRGKRSSRRRAATDEEVASLRGAAYTPREVMLIEFLSGTGLRIGSLTSIKVSDVMRGKIVLDSKGGGGTTTFVTDKMLGAAMKAKDRHNLSNDDFMFSKSHREKPTYKQLYLLFSGIASRAGVDIVPHQLRHEYATRALKHGARIDVVSELLGHRRLESTMVYVHTEEEDLRLGFDIANKEGA